MGDAASPLRPSTTLETTRRPPGGGLSRTTTVPLSSNALGKQASSAPRLSQQASASSPSPTKSSPSPTKSGYLNKRTTYLVPNGSPSDLKTSASESTSPEVVEQARPQTAGEPSSSGSSAFYSGLPEVWPPPSWADRRRHALGGYSVERRVAEMLKSQGIEYHANAQSPTIDAGAAARNKTSALGLSGSPTGWARVGMPPRERKEKKGKKPSKDERRLDLAKDAWAIMDADSDGKVGRYEIVKACEASKMVRSLLQLPADLKTNEASRELLNRLMERLDSDRSGKVSLGEFLKVVTEMKEHEVEEAQKEFDAKTQWQEAPEKIRDHTERAERERAAKLHARASDRANAAWREADYAEAKTHLDEMIKVNGDCDTLHRWRSRLHTREGRFKESVDDASRAVTLNPRGGLNYRAQGASLEAARELQGAGQAYLQAMRLGVAGSTKELGLARLLDTTQRDRDGARHDGFYTRGDAGSSHLKLGDGHGVAPVSSLGRARSNIFDPRLVLEGSGGADKRKGPSEPGPPSLLLEAVNSTSAAVRWEEGNDGGDEIYHFALELSVFHTKWRPATLDFFDDWLPFKMAHQGPYKVRSKVVGGLRPNTPVRLRVKCKNSMGDSPWSDELEVTTVLNSNRGASAQNEVPRSWMQADLSDVARKFLAQFGGATPEQFMDEAREALRPYVYELRRVYKLYEMLGAGPGGGVGSGISLMEFGRFVKDCGLMLPGRGKGKGWQFARGAKALPSGEIDLIFRRSNVQAAASGRRAAKEAMAFMEQAQEHLAGLPAAPTEDDDDEAPAKMGVDKQIDLISGAAEMSIQEWIGGLIRLAWSCFELPNDRADGKGGGGGGGGGSPERGEAAAAGDGASPKPLRLGARITALIQEAVLPGAKDHLNKQDPMEEHLANRRVRAVLEFYAPEIREIFGSYAQADQNSAGSLTSLDTLNLNETLFMLKEGQLMDEKLTLLAVTSIFAAVNAGAEEEEEGDDDEAELCYDEFVVMLARVCDCKVPEDTRNDTPFENVLQTWLHDVVIPEFKMILQLKRRGVGKTTL